MVSSAGNRKKVALPNNESNLTKSSSKNLLTSEQDKPIESPDQILIRQQETQLYGSLDISKSTLETLLNYIHQHEIQQAG